MFKSKHLGKNTTTGSRVVVVLPQLHNELDSALVIELDSLPPKYQDKVIEIAASPQAQQSHTKFYDMLNESTFPTGGRVLGQLHQEGLLQKVKVVQIDMTPDNNRTVPLSSVVGLDVTTTATEVAKEEEYREINDVTDTSTLARNMVAKARELETHARELKALAYEMLPELKPKSGRKPKSETTKDSE